jgi:Uncharacterized protein conserved in bacteria (DUF2325)
MRIAVIGGRERSDEQLARIAARSGYELEFHPGDLHGGVQELKSAVARSTLVVVVTEINSHGAVSVAKRAARQFERPLLVMRKLTVARMKLLIAALAARDLRGNTALAAAH